MSAKLRKYVNLIVVEKFFMFFFSLIPQIEKNSFNSKGLNVTAMISLGNYFPSRESSRSKVLVLTLKVLLQIICRRPGLAVPAGGEK